jgi:hypothetical protein
VGWWWCMWAGGSGADHRQRASPHAPLKKQHVYVVLTLCDLDP